MHIQHTFFFMVTKKVFIFKLTSLHKGPRAHHIIYLRMLSVKLEHNYHHKKLDGPKKRLNEQVRPQHIILVRAVV
jgi:hypothetical protein